MNSLNNRQYEALVDVRTLCAKRADIFRGIPVAEKMLAQLDAAVEDAAGGFAAHQSFVTARRRATVDRRAGRDSMRGALKAIAQTGPVVAIDAGTAAKFETPKSCSDLQLITIAKDFAARATPLAERFAAHRLPASVLADLPGQIEAQERAIEHQREARRGHKVARQAIVAALKSGAEAMDALECIYMNAFRGAASAVGDWHEARRIGPSRAADAPGDTPAQPPAETAPTTRAA